MPALAATTQRGEQPSEVGRVESSSAQAGAGYTVCRKLLGPAVLLRMVLVAADVVRQLVGEQAKGQR